MFGFKIGILSSLLISSFHAYAGQHEQVAYLDVETPEIPWFTGPLLTPTSINMEPGHPAIEPSVTVYSTYGLYNDNWGIKDIDSILTINPFLEYLFALTERTGIELQIQSFTNISGGKSSTSFGDTNVLFGYQLANDVKGTWIPDARLILDVTFPTGKYDKLDPKQPLREITGRGAFFFGPNLSFQKLLHFQDKFFVLSWAFGYFFPLRTHIKGVSLYGGSPDTRGSIIPGQYFDAFIAGQYAITQRWAVGFELEFLYQFRARGFRGFTGTTDNGSKAKVGFPSAAQVLFLPEIQYNFSARSGILAGGYFSLTGKNFPAVAGGFFAYLYVF